MSSANVIGRPPSSWAVDRDIVAALDHPVFVSEFDHIIADEERAHRLECRSPTETLPVYDGKSANAAARAIVPIRGVPVGHPISVRSLVGTVSAVCAARPVVVRKPAYRPPDWPVAVPTP